MATFAKGQKTAFVTGASSGIGKAAALALSRAGYEDAGHGGIFQYHAQFVPKALAFLAA